MKEKIFLDFDNTLMQFIDYFLNEINKIEGIELKSFNYTEEDNKEIVKKHYDFIKTGDHYSKMELFENSMEFIDNLNKKFDIHIVTSNISSDQKKYKNKYIVNTFGEKIKSVINARKKHPHTKEGDFIDDDIKKIKAHIENNETKGILINHNGMFNHNQEELEELKKHSNFIYCESFEDILNIYNLKKPKSKIKNQKSTNNINK